MKDLLDISQPNGEGARVMTAARVSALRRCVQGLDWRLAPNAARNATSGWRPLARAKSNPATLAHLLSAVGLYAVLAHVVAERTWELALRIALGASRSDILRLVLQRGLILASIRIGTGALASVFAVRLLIPTLFRVAPLDHVVFLGVIFVLGIVSLLAALIPTRRAAKFDPMLTVREG